MELADGARSRKRWTRYDEKPMVACANELSKGAKVCKTGVNFVTIMGDGGPAFFDGLNRALSKLGKQYTAKMVLSCGRSFGEDSFMTLPEVQADPQKGRGLLVAGVLKDGDWNIAMFWANANGICNNPDVTTYDPDCLNWVGTSSFVEADDKYIQGYCEDRPVVSKGKKTGQKKNVCVNGVVTWTPGDVAVAKNKGGIVPVLSTRENSSQMPNAFIGIDKWMKDNPDKVKGIVRAVMEAGNQIKTGGQTVLMKAADASAKIYKEETAAWWAKYYRGVEEVDKTGNLVRLGGSRVFNLADELRFLGLAEGSTNAFEATYVTFGNIAKQQYLLMPRSSMRHRLLPKPLRRGRGTSPLRQGKQPSPRKPTQPLPSCSNSWWSRRTLRSKSMDTPTTSGLRTGTTSSPRPELSQ